MVVLMVVLKVGLLVVRMVDPKAGWSVGRKAGWSVDLKVGYWVWMLVGQLAVLLAVPLVGQKADQRVVLLADLSVVRKAVRTAALKAEQ